MWDPKKEGESFSSSEARRVYFKLIKRGINFEMLGAQDLWRWSVPSEITIRVGITFLIPRKRMIG